VQELSLERGLLPATQQRPSGIGEQGSALAVFLPAHNTEPLGWEILYRERRMNMPTGPNRSALAADNSAPRAAHTGNQSARTERPDLAL